MDSKENNINKHLWCVSHFPVLSKHGSSTFSNHSTKTGLLITEDLLMCSESKHLSHNEFPSVFYIQWVNYFIWRLELSSGGSTQRPNFRPSSCFPSFYRSIIQYFSLTPTQNDASHSCFRLYLLYYFYRTTYKASGSTKFGSCLL